MRKSILKVSLIGFLYYSFFTILRSLSLLYLAYTDPYFYNFDWTYDFTMEKSSKFHIAFDLFPLFVGIMASLIIKIFIKRLHWFTFFFAIVIALISFTTIDTPLLRDIFYQFKNQRLNLIYHTSVFLLFSILMYKSLCTTIYKNNT